MIFFWRREMKILGLDFETTGLEAKTDRVIEIGAVVWCTESNKPLAIYSELIKPDGFIGLSDEIIKITGIEDQTLFDYGRNSRESLERLNELIESCDFICAHNADFDRSFYLQECSRLGVPATVKPWIDSMEDIPYANSISSRKLDYVAADHKILNPFSHRAVFDVLTMLFVLSKYKIDDVIDRSKSPKVEVTALVSFDEKDKAKSLGFRWDGKSKRWFKNYKKCELETMEFPFKIDIVEHQLSL